MARTECRQEALGFQGVSGKRVEARFNGGMVTTEAGALLLREVCERQGLFSRLARCFADHRTSRAVEHSVPELLKQRVYGLACGYEDLNDHDRLRLDAIFQLLVGRTPGQDAVIAGRNTLNRFELSGAKIAETERYKRIACDDQRMQRFFVEEFIRYARKRRLKEIVLDCDATDVPLHGKQEGRFYHGYYGNYCYLPLYIFCEDFPLWAELRSSNIDASAGTEAALDVIVPLIRKALPRARIIVRGDSGFAREGIMNWCETHGVHYVFGLAKNDRLLERLTGSMVQAEASFKKLGQPTRVFHDFCYRTLDSWSVRRRVIGKAEYLEKGPNPRFVVTSLTRSAVAAMELYENWYCQRGNMENRIKEQFQLFADRLSCSLKRPNQLRLWFSTVAYLALVLLKKFALQGTELANAEAQTIRSKLLKLAATVTVSARRVFFSLAEGFPFQDLFAKAARAVAR